MSHSSFNSQFNDPMKELEVYKVGLFVDYSSFTRPNRPLAYGADNVTSQLKSLNEIPYNDTPRYELLTGVDEPRASNYETAVPEKIWTQKNPCLDSPIETWNPEDEALTQRSTTGIEPSIPPVLPPIEDIFRLVKPPSILTPLPETLTLEERRTSHNSHGLVVGDDALAQSSTDVKAPSNLPVLPPIEDILCLVKPPSRLSPLPETPRKQKRRASYNFHGLMVGVPARQEKISYKCRQCRREFATKRGLQNHSRVHNAHGKRFECHLCNTIFTTRNALKVHTKKTHSIESSYHCSTCEKTFMSVASLSKHQLTHTQIRPKFCPLCGLSFVAKECLFEHVTKIHPDFCLQCVLDQEHNH